MTKSQILLLPGYVDISFLADHEACDASVRAFELIFPSGRAKLTLANLNKFLAQSDPRCANDYISWLLHNFEVFDDGPRARCCINSVEYLKKGLRLKANIAKKKKEAEGVKVKAALVRSLKKSLDMRPRDGARSRAGKSR